MTASTLITVAPTGAESAKADAPALPVTLDELVRHRQGVRGARRQRDARAHPRRRGPADARPGPAARHRRRAARVDRPDRPAVHRRRGHRPGGRPAGRARRRPGRWRRCTMGTVNFGDDVFLNRWEFIVELHTRMQERGIVPEYEIFDLGHLAALQRLLDKHGLPAGGHVHVDFVMGVPGGMPGTAAGAGRLRAGDARPAGGHHVLGHRHRPQHAAGHARLAVRRRAPAGRHGGHAHVRARASRSETTRSWWPGRPGSPGSPSARR